MPRALAVVAAAALFLSPKITRADDPAPKSVCVDAYEQAQRERLAGDLPGAREQLLVCSRDACPTLIRTDCVGWLREVEAAIPSVIVAVRDAAGADVPSAKISVDGQPLRPRVPGEAVLVKPGLRKFHVEVEGQPPVDREVLIQSGEKSRVISLVVGGPLASSAAGALKPSRGLPPPTVVLGVIGLTAAAVGIGVDVAGTVRLHDLRSSCAPNCSPGRVDGTRAEIITGDAILAAGVVAVGVAAIYFFTHRAAPRDGLAGAFLRGGSF